MKCCEHRHVYRYLILSTLIILRFDYSNSGSSFVRGQEISLTSGLQAAFNPIIQARFLRVVIVETNDVTENTKPIAING